MWHPLPALLCTTVYPSFKNKNCGWWEPPKKLLLLLPFWTVTYACTSNWVYIYIYTLYAHQKLFWAQVKSTSKRKQAVTYSRAQKLILLLGDGQDEKTELLNPRTKCLSDCKIPSAMLKKILINQKMLTNFDDRIRIII